MKVTDWQPYIGNRLIKWHSAKLAIIKPSKINLGTLPLSCPVCESLLKDSDDELHFRMFECCSRCANIWAYKNQKRWKTGWRPTKEEVKNQ